MKINRFIIRAFCLFGLWIGLGMQAHAQTDTVTYVYTDPQGTPLVKADAAGNVIARYDYTPYGNAVTSLGSPPNGPGYTGHVNDPETGLVYMQARYYQPTGRFVSPDPVVPGPGNIFSFNRYAYVDNNPVKNVDPTGRESSDLTMRGVAAIQSDTQHMSPQGTRAALGAAVSFVPVVGDVPNVVEAYNHPSLGSIAIAVIGALPEIGGVVADATKASRIAKDAGVLFHYTDAAGAAEIKASGMIKGDASGRVYLTSDKIAAKDANNALFMGQGGTKGTHVVEVNLRSGTDLRPGTQPNELIHQGAIRDGRQATLTVKINDN